MKCVVLYSGGLDSTVCLAQAIADPAYSDVLALTFDYGQSNWREVACARELAARWGFRHKVVHLQGLRQDATQEIPGRNTVFLSIALSEALQEGAQAVVFGAEPGSRYTDSSNAFLTAMHTLFELHDVDLRFPVKANPDKAATLRQALDLGIPLSLVHSCRRALRCYLCATCVKYRAAVEALFPAVNGFRLLDLLISEMTTYGMEGDKDYAMHGPTTGSFKSLPAAMLLASMQLYEFEGPAYKVFTTGNWGKSLQDVADLFDLEIELAVEETEDVEQLRSNALNTNLEPAVWGTKQALGYLPRPRYLGTKTLHGRVTQGHLRDTAMSLGYGWDGLQGRIRLHTE